MQVLHRKVRRAITEEEAVRLKEQEPFATFRQDSKSINFGMIFGMSYKAYSANNLETSWSLERIRTFIKEKKLEGSVDEMMEKYPQIEPKLWEYYAVAKFIRDQFFDSYKGLMERIKRNEAFAKENGFVRSYHGAIRRVPMLALCTEEVEGPQGRLVQRMRKDENMKEIANLVNITSNSTIQTDEAATVMDSVNKWMHSQYGEKFKHVADDEYVLEVDDETYSLVTGTVHDSVDFFVLKEYALEILAELQKTFERLDPWQKGVKFPIDLTIVDIGKGEYYKKGMKYKKFKELHGKKSA